jgi:release factor glutamine methyltransferase
MYRQWARGAERGRPGRAFDASPAAVRCARANVAAAGADVAVHLGSWARAAEFAPFDLVVSNPPYVPHDPRAAGAAIPGWAGPSAACNAGPDGRLVLDPLCRSVVDMLDDGGILLLVHSEFAGLQCSLRALRETGMLAEIVAEQWIPFGPVPTARAPWLEHIGLLEAECRKERLAVIRGRSDER